jgi:hypothetical protein
MPLFQLRPRLHNRHDQERENEYGCQRPGYTSRDRRVAKLGERLLFATSSGAGDRPRLSTARRHSFCKLVLHHIQKMK